MRVLKRSGKYEELSFDKITKRVKLLCDGLDGVEPNKVTQKTAESIIDGISTFKIDEISADVAANMSMVDHPNYEVLAARIFASNLQKNCPKTLVDALAMNPTIDPEVLEFARIHAKKLHIKKERDFLFSYFGLKTMQKIYLNVGETPQYLFMRVAIGIHLGDLKEVQTTYDLLSQKFFTHATPTMINAGTTMPQMSSCFLTQIKDDSIAGIYETLGDCAQISKHGGGIGIHAQGVRSKGSTIRGTNGHSDGIIPMCRVFNATARYVNQSGKRKGSFAVYLEPWHPDILEFLELRLNQGDEEARCRDLFTAMWIPDLFMKCVEKNETWALFDPDECPGLNKTHGEEFEILYNKYLAEGLPKKILPASTIWNAIIKSQIETGTPYMLYKDTCNFRNNQKNLGTLQGSNLCVAPETPILTKNGYVPISTLRDENVEVWNGSEWSSVIVKQTSESSELVRVQVDTGTFLECTPEHKFYVKNDYFKKPVEVRAKDLVLGDKLIKFECEPIEFGGDDFKYPYTHGFFCGDGTYSNNHIPHLSLYGEKMKLLDCLEIKSTSGKVDKSGRINTVLHSDIPDKFTVPSRCSIKTRLEWLSGYMDADGTYLRSGGVQISCIHLDFLRKIQLMLHTLGIQSKITMMPDGKGGTRMFDCKRIWRICISQTYVEALVNIGLDTKRLDTKNALKDNRKANWFPKVESVTWSGRISPTYCFTESKKHMGVFNGLLTGQCCEILEHTAKDEIAVCNLASISLPAFVSEGAINYESLHEITMTITRNLNKIIDRNYYPVKEGRSSNERHRPIGIGIQGLADVYMLIGIAFDSKEARIINRNIFETIYHGALEQSMELAKKDGHYSSFREGPLGPSPASEGLLQFDLAGVVPGNNRYDWDHMKKKIRQTGLRNSLLLAPMPTATTSQVLGNNECFEPYTTNIYLRRTLAGEFTVVNNHLVRDLQKLGLWTSQMKNAIIEQGGSVQGIKEIPDHLKSIYKTVWEISQKVIIEQARDRGAFVCQSQSMNLFVEDPSVAKLSSMHMYAWKQGLKTGMYYLRTRPKVKPIQVTIEPQTQCRWEPGCVSCGS